MVDQLSPLAPVLRPGRHAQADGVGVTLAEVQPGSIVQLAAWRGEEGAMISAIRIAGPKAEWVLAKFFAIDFSLPALPVGSGLSTVHHDIFAQIQRTGADRFDVYVFRSFARSFWGSLCHASEEVGYEVR